jgi:adenylate cyclase
LAVSARSVETDRHRRDLRESLAEARVREAKIDGELAAAKEIQLGMLPDTTALSSLPRHVELRAFLEPARSIGGDLYDAFMLDDRRLYFMVGDVTGKGVPASLFMALAKALSKSVVLREGSDLEEAVMAANAEISRENTSKLSDVSAPGTE